MKNNFSGHSWDVLIMIFTCDCIIYFLKKFSASWVDEVFTILNYGAREIHLQSQVFIFCIIAIRAGRGLRVCTCDRYHRFLAFVWWVTFLWGSKYEPRYEEKPQQ